MSETKTRAGWSDDDRRYVNATYSPTSRLTEDAWLLAGKAMGNYSAWLAANPAPADDGE